MKKKIAFWLKEASFLDQVVQTESSLKKKKKNNKKKKHPILWQQTDDCPWKNVWFSCV